MACHLGSTTAHAYAISLSLAVQLYILWHRSHFCIFHFGRQLSSLKRGSGAIFIFSPGLFQFCRQLTRSSTGNTTERFAVHLSCLNSTSQINQMIAHPNAVMPKFAPIN